MRTFWLQRYGSIAAFVVCALLFLQCSSPDPQQEILHQWGSQQAGFDPARPTVLYAFDVSTCLSCGLVGLKALIGKIRKLGLEANVLVVVASDQPGESQVLWDQFPRDMIIEDTLDALSKVFQVQTFPTMLVIAPDGTVLQKIPDPVHHFPSDDELRQLLAPTPQTLSEFPIHRSGPRTILAQIDDAVYLSHLQTSILLDKSQNKIFSLHTGTDSLFVLWKPADSLRFLPPFAPTTAIPDSLWARFKDEYGYPFLAVYNIAGVRDSTVIISFFTSFPRDPAAETLDLESQLGLLFLRLQSPRTAQLDSVVVLDGFPPKNEQFFFVGNQLLTFDYTDSVITGWEYRDGQWQELPFHLRFNPSEPASFGNAIRFPLYPVPLSSGAVLISLKLEYPVWLQWDSTQQQIIATPCCQDLFWLPQYRAKVHKLILSHFGGLRSMQQKMGLAAVPAEFQDRISTLGMEDSLVVLLFPFVKVDSTPRIDLGIDVSSIHHRYAFLSADLPEHRRKDQNRPVQVAVVAADPTQVIVLAKWKRIGWKGYRIPLKRSL